MKTIDAFSVDHNKIEKGMYISRIDDDIVTYDIRMVKPNTPPYLENAGLHSFEHIFATFMRNTEYGKNIVYVGPMGCRTGFYLLTRGLSNNKVINLTNKAMDYISNFEGEIPGSKKSECGNYLEHDLSKAREYASDMKEILKDWKESDLKYY
mgnify:CR=1 FL=1